MELQYLRKERWHDHSLDKSTPVNFNKFKELDAFSSSLLSLNATQVLDSKMACKLQKLLAKPVNITRNLDDETDVSIFIRRFVDNTMKMWKTQYLPDYSKDKSMLIDLNTFKELDAYASKVDAADSVKNLVSTLLQNAHSDLEKARAIWIWITHHIAYDVDYYYDNAKTSCEPADILLSRKTICAGYANLFKEMCSIAGIQCQKLTGISNGKGPKNDLKKKKRHAWNAVCLDGKWHLVDCTWGSGFVDDHKFIFKYKELYFLPCPELYPFQEDPQGQLHTVPAA